MSIKERLAEIVGEDNVSDAPEVIEAYSRDHSLTPPGLFTCVVTENSGRGAAGRSVSQRA